jgi:predicted Zn-dependent peptidase
LRLENQPYGPTSEVFDALAYEHFAYQHSTIGSMADLNAATVDDVASFFKTYYAPNNATLAIVGDVDTHQTLARVRRYFETIPRQAPPPAVDHTEPPQTAERRKTIEDGLARVPRIDIGYHIPSGDTKDYDALWVLSTILSSGRSSRLYDAVIRQKQLASGAAAFVPSTRGPGLFRLYGLALPGKDIVAVEGALYEEIERVKNGAIADWEMEKAHNEMRANLLSQLTSSLQRSVRLAEEATFWNDPNRINTISDAMAAVTSADVQRVARRYLVASNRTVVITMPKTTTGPTATKGGF